MAAAGRGELGPADIAELQDDAVDTALRDQEEAGIDVVTDGEMRRAGFFTAEFYRHLTGLRALEPERRVGAAGHDQQHRFEVLEPIAAPDGLGVVEEFRSRGRATAAQGHAPGAVHPVGTARRWRRLPERLAAAEAFVPILAAEVRALVAEGATFIQIDEPSPAIHPDAPADFAALFNPVVADVPAGVRLAAHLCFGNFMGRPLAKRTYRPVLDQLRRFAVHELVLEFANREMAEPGARRADRSVRHRGRRDRRQELVRRDRVRRRRADRPGARARSGGSPVARTGLWLLADGRAVSRAKLHALVDGRDLVRGRR